LVFAEIRSASNRTKVFPMIELRFAIKWDALVSSVAENVVVRARHHTKTTFYQSNTEQTNFRDWTSTVPNRKPSSNAKVFGLYSLYTDAV
jgi:hypothetical protein